MKLEFLPDGSPDCPLVRLYAFNAGQVERLQRAIARIASRSCTSFEVHAMADVEPLCGSRLTLILAPCDGGVVLVAAPATFECHLTWQTWDNISGLLEPFVAGQVGYQWLTRDGEASLLLSADGTW